MLKVVAINGSPRMEKGTTAMLLNSFTQGMVEGGCEVEVLYASRLDIRPCSCGRFYCWRENPGTCCFQDDMQWVYPKLKAAELLIIATPVYIPLPGDMQNMLNRLCPLLDPTLEKRLGRTRARFRQDVHIQKIVLVSTSGWWEIENFDTVVRVVKELTEDASVEFGGAVLRPHAALMKVKGEITQEGEAVLEAVRRAGNEWITTGSMNQETLRAISRPLDAA